MTDERTVELWPVNLRTGLWCTRCQLPSVVEFDLATLEDDGVTVVAEATTVCTECPSGDTD